MEVSFDTLENPFFPLSASVNPIGSREILISTTAHSISTSAQHRAQHSILDDQTDRSWGEAFAAENSNDVVYVGYGFTKPGP